MATKKKEKKEEVTLEALRKEFGKNTVGKFHDVYLEPESIPTGSVQLDKALNGGWKTTKVHELWGLEASGKTCLTLQAIAECQQQGNLAAFIDVEQAFDPKFAAGFGVDLKELILVKPDNGEQVFEVIIKLVELGVRLIVIDSVAAMLPSAEADKVMGAGMAQQARMMSQGLRTITPIVGKNPTAVIFINQIREKPGVMFGDPRTTSGGNSLKYYASLRLEISAPKNDYIMPPGANKDTARIGHKMVVKFKKSKVGRPHPPISFDVRYFEGGIDKCGEICDLALSAGILEKNGTWYAYNDQNIGQGRDKTVAFLKEHSGVYEEIKTRLSEMIESLDLPEVEFEAEADDDEV